MIVGVRRVEPYAAMQTLLWIGADVGVCVGIFVVARGILRVICLVTDFYVY